MNPGDEIENGADFIEINCPACGRDASYSATDALTLQECPHCPEVLLVPEPGGGGAQRLPVPIRTPRLILRRLESSDVGDMLQWQEELILQYLPDAPADTETLHGDIAGDRSVLLSAADGGLWLGIGLANGERLVGEVKLTYSREPAGAMRDRQMTIRGLIIGPEFQRQGYGAEVLDALLDFGFRGLHVRRITAWCDSRNEPAFGLLTKAGMRNEGEFLEQLFAKGAWVDNAYFAMLAKDYQGPVRANPTPLA